MKELEQLQKEHQELGNRIQELKDSLNKPKGLEIGRWYRHTYKGRCGPIINYQGGKSGYGFDGNLNWRYLSDGWNFCSYPEYWSLATEQEVKDALIKEAERRGYKEGVEIKHPLYRTVGFLDNDITGFKNNCFTEFWYKGSIVMKDGKWATIIKDDVISIGGYKVVFAESRWKNKYTSIDGNDFFIDFWQAAKLISEHSKAKVMIGCNCQFDLSVDVINKILDKLK